MSDTTGATSSGIAEGRRVVSAGPILLSPSGSLRPQSLAQPRGGERHEAFLLGGAESGSGGSGGSGGNSGTAMDIGVDNDSMDGALKGLFGGAIQVKIPNTFDDISTVRQVPDHQEVFVDKNSETSIIIELLAHDDKIDNSNIMAYYFEDLANSNESIENNVLFSEMIIDQDFFPHIDGSFAKFGLIGRQKCTKFNATINSKYDIIDMYMMLIRIKTFGTDVLVTINNPQSGIDELGNDMAKRTSFFSSQSDEPCDMLIDLFQKSFQVMDWSLFA